MRFLKKKKKDERGSIVIEGTVALTTFMFTILIILDLVNICYIQSKMAVALNSASKEMSQYSYLYTALTLDEYMTGSGGKSSEIMAGFSEVLNKISDGTANFSSELSSMFSNAGNVAAGDSAAEYIKDGIGMLLANQLTKKNLKSFEGDSADAFMRRNNMSGLNFLYTSFLTDVDQSEVDIVATYKVKVIQFLNIDYSFTFVQRAKGKAWGKGVSLKNPTASSGTSSGSIWDSGAVSRGDAIIASEKKNYSYTGSKNSGFHAVDTDSNEFVRIRSIDTHADTYANSNPPTKEIKNQLKQSFNQMEVKVTKLGTDVSVTDSNGETQTVQSDPNSRKYKVVLVVPDDADMATVNAAAKEFESEQALAGKKVTVEVKTGYGSPTPPTPPAENSDAEESD